MLLSVLEKRFKRRSLMAGRGMRCSTYLMVRTRGMTVSKGSRQHSTSSPWHYGTVPTDFSRSMRLGSMKF
jgi:hypothetical protein